MSRLVLARRRGESIMIGDDIVITIGDVSDSGNVKVIVSAPRDVRVDRREVYENKINNPR